MLIDDYPLRITGGSDSTNGLVEYLSQDRWRTILNHNRQLNVGNATMICRLLGFTRGTVVTRREGPAENRFRVQCHSEYEK